MPTNMKYILLIYSLFLCSIGMAQSVSLANGGSSADQTSASIPFSFASNNVFVLNVIQRNTAGTPPIPTLSTGNSNITWQQVATTTYHNIAAPIYRMTLFVCANTTTTTQSPNTAISWGGTTINGVYVQMYSCVNLTPITSNGLGNIRQIVTLHSDSTTNPTISFPSTPSSVKNALLVLSSNHGVPFSAPTYNGTPPTGWTENEDGGYNNGMCRYAMSRVNTSDQTPMITVTTKDWTAFGVEVVPGIRRRNNLN
jgi:hypothetical protein